jgi:hypothetical protein
MNNQTTVRILIGLFLALITIPTWAAPSQFVYEGILLDSADQPVTGSKNFKASIKIGSDICYNKSFSTVLVTEGNFKLTLTESSAFSANSGVCSAVTNFSSLWKVSGIKELILEVENASSVYETFGAIPIESVPYAMEALQEL